jgi:hypothetical protein
MEILQKKNKSIIFYFIKGSVLYKFFMNLNIFTLYTKFIHHKKFAGICVEFRIEIFF